MSGIGMWGLGMIGKTHLEAMRLMGIMFPDMPPVDPAVLCTREPDSGKTRLFETVTTDASALFGPQVELVDIPSPNYVHKEQASRAIAAGKAVYLEKPVASQLADAAELVRCAEAAGVVNRVPLIYRFVPGVAALRALIRSGRLGEILHFRLHYYHYSYLDPQRPTSWRQQAALSGGGSMLDLGVHFADILRLLLGEAETVYALQKTAVKRRYTDAARTATVANDTEEWCLAAVTMASGAMGSLETSRVTAHVGPESVVEVYGTKGGARFTDERPYEVEMFDPFGGARERIGWQSLDDAHLTYLRTVLPPSRHEVGWFMGAHLASLKSAVDAARGVDENPLPATFREAYEAQRVAEAAARSAQEGRPVALAAWGEI